jgi:hypothetical protein
MILSSIEMNFQLLICWPGIYHDDSELWQEYDDGTYAKPAAAFIQKVILPSLTEVLTEFACKATRIRISDGERLLEIESESLPLSTSLREKQWDEHLESISSLEKDFLECKVPEGKTVHFQLMIDGEDEGTKSPFSIDQDGIAKISLRLMQELAKKEMLSTYVVGGYAEDRSPFIDYLYSEDMSSIHTVPAFCGADISLLKKAWGIRGDLSNLFIFFAKSDISPRHEESLSDLPNGALPSILCRFNTDPDLVLGDPLKLMLIRSGDGDRDYSITLERPILDKYGDPEDYEILETFGSSQDSLCSALDAYLKAGGVLDSISRLL